MNAATPDLAAFRAAIGDVPASSDAATLKLKSRDFFWFSPILKPLLEGRQADLVVSPRDKADVTRVAAAAARNRVPLTVRGGGTGNYGQAVPLAGGVVLDLAGLDRTVRAVPGAGRFEAGATMLAIDRALRPRGWEMRFFPSTRRQATIGGFIAGGAAGAGSCTWGQIADPGAVIAVEVVTVEETPRILELSGRDVLKVVHAYGTNGIITEVAVPLAPCQPYAERIIAFPSLSDAARFGMAFTAAEGIAKKLVTILDGRIPPLIRKLKPIVPERSAAALVMVAEPQAPAMAEMAADFAGKVVWARDAEASEAAALADAGAPPLYEYAWNHTTLHALKSEPGMTYLQVRFPAGRELETIAAVEAAFGDEMLLHLEYQRRFGRVFVSSLPLLRFRSAERLAAVIDQIAALGGSVSNPHTYVLDGAGWKRTDAPQRAFKRLADPHSLLNPGKLADLAE
ncbi:MAG: FAD-binding oxidoreductase [Bauldia sp.]|nr:FAD-binding oxidoreductase [Bauldia sp.]